MWIFKKVWLGLLRILFKVLYSRLFQDHFLVYSSFWYETWVSSNFSWFYELFRIQKSESILISPSTQNINLLFKNRRHKKVVSIVDFMSHFITFARTLSLTYISSSSIDHFRFPFFHETFFSKLHQFIFLSKRHCLPHNRKLQLINFPSLHQ